MARKAPTAKQTTEVANWDETLAQAAREASAAEVAGGASQYISIQGGRFTLNKEVLPEPLRLVVVQAVYDNAYYEQAYDPSNPTSPTCFALSYEHDELAPPDDMPGTNQSKLEDGGGTCAGCWADAFGTSGRGKACKNSRRLAVVSAHDDSQLEKIVDGSAQLFILRLPPTAIKHWSSHVKGLDAVESWPYWMFNTEFILVPGGQGSMIPAPRSAARLNPEVYYQHITKLRERAIPMLLDDSSYRIEREEAPTPTRRKPAPTAKKKARKY